MPFYIGDYLADTLHLSRDQHGGYMLLIIAYWRNGSPLIDDDGSLGAITKSAPAEWRKLRPVMARFFIVKDGYWHHKRIDHELGKAKHRTEERSNAGAKGAAKRWQTDSSAIAKPMANASQNDGPLQSQSQEEEKSSLSGAKKAPAKRRQVPEDWLPSEAGREFALERAGWSGARIEREIEHFRYHHRKKGEALADIDAGWRTWVINGDKYQERGGNNGTIKSSPGTVLFEGAFRAAENYDRRQGNRSHGGAPDEPLLDSGGPA
jgi:uncharacterized protein YdaU (DUF1376 family)